LRTTTNSLEEFLWEHQNLMLFFVKDILHKAEMGYLCKEEKYAFSNLRTNVLN